MDKLKELEIKLKAKRTFQIEVLDTVTGAVYQRAVNQEYLDQNNNGSLTAYLQNLHEKGLQKIQLLQKLKNGSSTKPDGPSVTVDFRKEDNNAPQAPASPFPLGGLNGSFGLGMPEIMDGFAAKRELAMWKENYRKLEQDYKEERESKRKWRDKAEKYSRENERYEYKEDIQREPSAIDKLIEGLASNPASIPALIGAFKGGSGLNAPHPQQLAHNPLEGYTEMQLALCDMIGQCPDNFCEELANLISRVSEQDQEFIKQLQKILETPKVEKNG